MSEQQVFESEFERGIERYANMLFANARAQECLCRRVCTSIPKATCSCWTWPNAARRAVAWFARHAPCRYQPLPISDDEQEHVSVRGDVHRLLTVFFSCSLRRQGFDYVLHPGFYQYSTGLLADPYCPVPVNPELLRDFPPRRLMGLDGIYWSPVPWKALVEGAHGQGPIPRRAYKLIVYRLVLRAPMVPIVALRLQFCPSPVRFRAAAVRDAVWRGLRP